MPHLIVEYSGNIEHLVGQSEVVKVAHGAMVQSGLFASNAIRSRAYRTDDFMVGDMGADGSFLHIIIYLLAGRTVGQKQELNQGVLGAMVSCLPTVNQISVDIRDINKETYGKSG